MITSALLSMALGLSSARYGATCPVGVGQQYFIGSALDSGPVYDIHWIGIGDGKAVQGYVLSTRDGTQYIWIYGTSQAFIHRARVGKIPLTPAAIESAAKRARILRTKMPLTVHACFSQPWDGTAGT